MSTGKYRTNNASSSRQQQQHHHHTQSSATAAGIQKKHAKTARGTRFLNSREPQTVEFAKMSLFFKGSSSNEIVNQCMLDLHSMKKPDSVMMNRANPNMRPFEIGGESESSLEFFSRKNDCTFLIMGQHSKKRPNSLVISRMFDHRVLDQIELSIQKYTPISLLGGKTAGVGCKPAFIFSGPLFQELPNLKMLQNILLDMFRGYVADELNLGGLEHVIMVVATGTGEDDCHVLFRPYHISLKKSGTRVPAVELSEMGPRIDWKVGRTREANHDLMKQAMRVPKELHKRNIKNKETTVLGETLGRVHVGDQKLQTIQTRKLKAFKGDDRSALNADSVEQDN